MSDEAECGFFLAKRPSGSRNWGLDLASLVVFI